MSYYAIKTEPQLWTVGQDINGRFETVEDFGSKAEANEYAIYLNGGPLPSWMKQEEPVQDQLTLRDQFAMSALQGLIANSSRINYEKSAKESYKYADAMLAERAK